MKWAVMQVQSLLYQVYTALDLLLKLSESIEKRSTVSLLLSYEPGSMHGAKQFVLGEAAAYDFNSLCNCVVPDQVYLVLDTPREHLHQVLL